MKKFILGLILLLSTLTSCSQNEELVMECKQGNRDKDFSFLAKISTGKLCFVDPSGRTFGCVDVSTLNSKIVKTKNFNSKSSELGKLLDVEQDIYLKIDRNTGMMGGYFASNDQNMNIRNELINCTKKEKL